MRSISFSFILRVSVYIGCAVHLLAPANAQNDLTCAVVKMEIAQELTLERQAFEGRLTLTNGLPIPLENLEIELAFLDAERTPVESVSKAQLDASVDSSNALFFHKCLDASVTSQPTFNRESIPSNAVDGVYHVTADINAQEAANIIFQIIPSPDAADDSIVGLEYAIGAIIRYGPDGSKEVIVVEPDIILVMPMPELQLDYFLPYYVYGDEPTTLEIEPVIPFDLGLRIRNSGFGTVNNLRVNSGQPAITDNSQGLALTFRIIGSEVNGISQEGDLLVDFGEIKGGVAASARWNATSSLSGAFTLANVKLSHSNELGGEITSLINDATTYTLVGSVLDQGDGSDHIDDFLAAADDATNGGRTITKEATLQLYTSNKNESYPVQHLDAELAVPGFTPSGNLTLLLDEDIVIPEEDFRVYIRMADPHMGSQSIKQVVRSDGKILPEQNVWLTTTRKAANPNVPVYDLHLYDSEVENSMSYNIEFGAPGIGNQAPVFAPLGSIVAPYDSPLAIAVTAVDPDGDSVIISSGLLPYGAGFTFDGVANPDGSYSGEFEWTPSSAFKGNTYEIEFVATDGVLNSRSYLTVFVSDPSDTMLDAWLADNGLSGALLTDDNDLDGRNNLIEYAFDGDPNLADVKNLPIPTVISSAGSDFLCLSFIRRTSINDSTLSYDVVASDAAGSDLTTWNTTGTISVSTDQTGVPNGFERVNWTDSRDLKISPAASGRFAAVKVSYNAEIAYTYPVGVQLINLGSQTDNYLSLPLQRAPKMAHSIAQINAQSTAIRIASSAFNPSEFTGSVGAQYYIEMISGGAAGHYWPIIGNSESWLYLDGTLTGVAMGDHFIIRPEYRVDDLFAGAMQSVSTGQFQHRLISGDALMLYGNAWTPIGAEPDLTIQQLTDGSTAWLAKEDSDSLDRSTTPLPWGSPFVVRRQQAVDETIYLLGDVPTANWQAKIPAYSGAGAVDLLVGIGFAETITIANASLVTDGAIASSPSALEVSDELLVHDPSRKGYYLPPELFLVHTSSGWVSSVSGQNYDSLNLEPGKAYRIRRREAASATTWTPGN